VNSLNLERLLRGRGAFRSRVEGHIISIIIHSGLSAPWVFIIINP
jgi:hypothetical protein